jgi:hypothetical protein
MNPFQNDTLHQEWKQNLEKKVTFVLHWNISNPINLLSVNSRKFSLHKISIIISPGLWKFESNFQKKGKKGNEYKCGSSTVIYQILYYRKE